MQTTPTSPTDPILETQVFLGRYKVPILLGLAVVICAVAAYAGYRIYETNREAKASALLAEAKAAPDYEKVISQYPGAGAAASAYLLMAMDQREKKQYAEANATLEKFVNANPKHELVTTAKMAMASNLDSMGKTDAALDMYKQIGANYAQSYNAPLAMLAQAQILKAKGQDEEARRVCETVMTQYRESYASMEAMQILKALKPAATPVPVAPVAASSSPAAAAPSVAPTPAAAPSAPSAMTSPVPSASPAASSTPAP